MSEFPVEHSNTSKIQVLEPELDGITIMKDDYQDAIELYLDRLSHIMTVNTRESWRREVTANGLAVISHADRIRTRAAQVTAVANSNANSVRTLEIQEETLKLQELSINNAKQTSEQQRLEQETSDLLSAESEANILIGECSVLGDMMGLEIDWESADDDVIGNGMRNLAGWQEQMNTIERSFRKFENVKSRFTSDRQEAIQQIYDENKEKFQTARSSLKKEDADRGLYTLEPVRSDIIKYPTFSGLPSEDLLKFVETMQQRFRENKVKKKEQVAKLREFLTGAALGRVG